LPTIADKASNIAGTKATTSSKICLAPESAMGPAARVDVVSVVADLIAVSTAVAAVLMARASVNDGSVSLNPTMAVSRAST
jgi:hypothetical protein